MSFRDDREALVSLVAAMRQRAERAEAMVAQVETQRDRLAAQLKQARSRPSPPPPPPQPQVDLEARIARLTAQRDQLAEQLKEVLRELQTPSTDVPATLPPPRQEQAPPPAHGGWDILSPLGLAVLLLFVLVFATVGLLSHPP